MIKANATHSPIAVIKYGGNAMTDEHLKQCFAEDLVHLQKNHIRPVVVHGGGPQISAALKQSGQQTHFINGERVTDLKTLEIVEMVLSGNVNKDIVQLIQNKGGLAVGISGKDGNLIFAEVDPDKTQLGYVGRVKKVNPELIYTLMAANFIPVIAPVSTSEDGTTYNVNADFAASAIAAALQAQHLLLLSNIPGVLDAQGQVIEHLNAQKVADYIADGIINEGMLPKINCALSAIQQGVEKVQIIDGRVAHILDNQLLKKIATGTSISQ